MKLKGIRYCEGEFDGIPYTLFLFPNKETTFARSGLRVIDGKISFEIQVGTKGEFTTIIENLLHEFQEVWMLKNNMRVYTTNPLENNEDGDCTFIIKHYDFQYMCEKVSEVICEIYNHLQKDFKEKNI